MVNGMSIGKNNNVVNNGSRRKNTNYWNLLFQEKKQFFCLFVFHKMSCKAGIQDVLTYLLIKVILSSTYASKAVAPNENYRVQRILKVYFNF